MGTILVVGHTAGSDRLVARLRETGWRVLRAPGSAEAVEILARSTVDALVVRHPLLGANTAELFDDLRAARAAAIPPIYVLDGLSDPQTRATFVSLGARSVLADTPAGWDELIAQLRS